MLKLLKLYTTLNMNSYNPHQLLLFNQRIFLNRRVLLSEFRCSLGK